ncbi:MAG: T9SS type A sorting domain-containing protein [Bacteroidales bacterium]|nr:T9SS type A sorting domain-containing protein [Bacteroidales bacterium]MCF8454312.1 T9SS type A sorting domain-containing protein [Bacteroidales bacterium]
MKKILLFSVSLLCGFVFNLNAQDYIRFDASFYSEALEMVKKVDVYIPGDYYLHPDQKYATIYYLHGAGGDEGSGSTEASLYYQLHEGYNDISSPPAIFVCPDGSCEPYMGSMWVNSPLYGNYEDFVMQDVIQFVESNFRAIPEKNFRAICGLSMGGFGSAWLTLNCPDSFRVCFPYIGALAFPDTTLSEWRDLVYNENNSYILNYNAGFLSQVHITTLGGWTPNMDLPPYYVEPLFDSMGNWVDTSINKGYHFDCSRRVKDLQNVDSLAWFLGAGKTDYMMIYPTYQMFMDSLEYYNIDYSSYFFNGGHEYHAYTWYLGLHFIDSIFYESFVNSPYLLHSINSTSASIPFRIYPNPISDQVNISYKLSKPCNVKLEIRDIYGKLLAVLEDGKQLPGEIALRYNLSKYPAGMYFIKLESEEGITIRKIIKVMGQ